MKLPRPSFAALPDGRVLAYDELGDPDGFPVVFCHNWPGSRVDGLPMAGAALQAGVRLVCPDRPGIGESESHELGTLSGWAADVHALMRSLGIQRYSVVGWGGGAPSAIACASILSGHVVRIGIVGGFGPLASWDSRGTLGQPARTASRLARRSPLALRMFANSLARRIRNASSAGLRRQVMANLSPPDRDAVVARPEIADYLEDSLIEAFRMGATGPALDIALMVAPWGFELNHISTQVLLWHGTEDARVGIEHALEYQRHLLNPRLQVLEGQGHLIAYTRAGELLEALKEGAGVS